jgi:hypothetical protein
VIKDVNHGHDDSINEDVVKGVNGKVQNALTQTMHVWSSSIYFPNTKILQQNIAVVGQEVVFAITYTSQ